jgi:hypothetical protein
MTGLKRFRKPIDEHFFDYSGFDQKCRPFGRHFMPL